jgi:hypothetical protein
MFSPLLLRLLRLRQLKATKHRNKRHNKPRNRDNQGIGVRPALRLMCRTGKFRLRHPTPVNTVNPVNPVNTVNPANMVSPVNTRELFKSLPAR